MSPENERFLYEYRLCREMGWTVEELRETPRDFLVRLGVLIEERRKAEDHRERMERLKGKRKRGR